MSNITDDLIINLFFGKRQLKHQVYKKYIVDKEDEDIYNYIANRFNDQNDDFKETLQRIKYGIEVIPKCPICGNKCVYTGGDKNGKIYTDFCSVKCAQNDVNVRKKRFDSSVEKYGKGCNLDKMVETNLEKRGVRNCFQDKDCIDKSKETCLKRYGVDNIGKTEWLIEKRRSEEANEKRNETKRKNRTFNSSKPEQDALTVLENIYGKSNVKTQYKTDKYPFNCDFYIVTEDLYIELNYHWTHGGHAFNKNNRDDLDKVELWKSKESQYYLNAIKTWTIRDVNKLEAFKQNNLNYVVFYNKEDFEHYFDYRKAYEQILNNAQKREDPEYFEIHHIVPKCMGGSNDENNLVKLTLREHYIVHKLLHYIYPENKPLANAFWMMSNRVLNDENVHLTAREYEESKKAYIDSAKGKKRTEEQKRCISEATKKAMRKDFEIVQKSRVNKGSKWYRDKETGQTFKWFPGDEAIDLDKYEWGRSKMSDECKEKISRFKEVEKDYFYIENLNVTYVAYRCCIKKVPERWVKGNKGTGAEKLRQKITDAARVFNYKTGYKFEKEIYFEHNYKGLTLCIYSPAVYECCEEEIKNGSVEDLEKSLERNIEKIICLNKIYIEKCN